MLITAVNDGNIFIIYKSNIIVSYTMIIEKISSKVQIHLHPYQMLEHKRLSRIPWDMQQILIDGGYMIVILREILDGLINLHFGLFQIIKIKFRLGQKHTLSVIKRVYQKVGVTS